VVTWAVVELLGKLKNRARATPAAHRSAEGEDDRVIQAAARVHSERYAKITLLGRADTIRAAASRLGVKLEEIEILNPLASPRLDAYARIYLERRRARGTTLEEAHEAARKPLYFAALSVAAGDADASVGGARIPRQTRSAPRCIPSVSRQMRAWYPVFS